jgi:hypothetical protein
MKNNYRSWVAGGVLLLCASSLNAQNKPLAQLVAQTRDLYASRVYESAPFTVSNAPAAKGEISTIVKNATLLNLSVAETRKMWQQKPQYAVMRLPVENQPMLELELVQQSPLAEGFKLTTNTSNDNAVPYTPGAYYRGIIKGHPNSTVAISVFENEIIGIASTENGDNLVLGKLDRAGNESDYILYSDKDLPQIKTPGCATIEPEGYKEKLREYLQETAAKTTDASHCVKVYLECDYALRNNKGSVTAAANYITAVFNNVATLYANELVTTAVSQVFVWDTPDSYNTTSSGTALDQFRTTRTTFNGNIAHLAALGGNNVGGIAYIDVICNQSYHYAYSNIYASYSTVPTYSWTVYVMTHEMGHNLGSPHTQSCSWTGGALDNCYTTEGGCAPGPAPTNGGTIMSYCHLTSYGINFNNGFGTQPGNLIRSRVNSAACLTACSGTPITYCASQGTNTTYEYVNKVQLNTINKTSGNNNGYADFTATDITTLSPGSAYTATLTPGFTSGAYSEYWAVWIDYNKDGDFADAGEAVGTASGSGAVTVSFTVPSGVSGTTRMRVSMKYGALPTACETFTYGEVEDYSIQLGSGASPAPTMATTTPATLFPNPARDEVHIRWSSATTGQATISVTDLAGRKLADVQQQSNAGTNDYLLPLRDMPAGNYLVNVQADGQLYHYKLTVTH